MCERERESVRECVCMYVCVPDHNNDEDDSEHCSLENTFYSEHILCVPDHNNDEDDGEHGHANGHHDGSDDMRLVALRGIVGSLV